jgi:hypothetical protein
MKSAPFLPLALLFGSLSLSAQNADQTQMGLTVVQVIPGSPSCPIGMHVRQGIGSPLLAVKDGHTTKVFAARLRMNLDTIQPGESSAKQITAATVTVHGLNGKPRTLLVGKAPNHSAEVTKTMAVTLAPDNDKSFWTDLVLPGFTSANMVDLESVTYADGSTWKLTDHDGWCHAAPDPIMLIGAAR